MPDSNEYEGKAQNGKRSGWKDSPEESRTSSGDTEEARNGAHSGGQRDDERHEDDQPKGPPIYKRPVFIISVSIAVVALGVIGLLYWLHARQYESTDDAYIDGHVTQMRPRISGPIVKLNIRDNQYVQEGDVLLELDATDYRVAKQQAAAKVESAMGNVSKAEAQIDVVNAAVAQAKAEADAAKVKLDNATSDLKRYQSVDQQARSQQQLERAETDQKNAAAGFERAKAQQASASANVIAAQAAVKAARGELAVARANLDQAEVNLTYCRIIAPCDGRVTQRTVEIGTFLQAGQTMFSLVSSNIWVTANFKETQLTRMQPEQEVTIKVDAFPDEELTGHVDSIQAGTGARFSILPAENATGNYVKVVQRVPVKIVFDAGQQARIKGILSPGLSVVPRVKVR